MSASETPQKGAYIAQPFFRDLHNHSRDQSKTRRLIGEYPHYTRPALYLLIQTLNHVVSPNTLSMRLREVHDGKTFGDIDLHLYALAG